MLEWLWLIPAIPVASAVVLAVFGARLPHRAVSAAGVGSIAASAAVNLLIAARFLSAPPAGGAFVQTLWTWVAAGDLRADIGFRLDALSLVMTAVVTSVSFLIHLYSTEYMREDEGYSRFFAYMNLFVASMTILLLADNLLLLFLGWEGVGLCSYLLIGFWYRDRANGLAARKAFIVTRVGDTAFTIGLLLLFTHLGTFDIQQLMTRAAAQWRAGAPLATWAALLLLGGAVGKSAQLPLQTWLPDAMAGPTPTSALIHAATMVTAGVYLIARTHTLFLLSPAAMTAVAAIGAASVLLAGSSALVQTDLKRILAYSTMSQIGYMFLALGAGAWSAAIFHFWTHAFFKALLFLAAGIVIEAAHHEQNIFRLGGLRRELPAAFWAFVVGGSALAGLPYVTAGFYSKDLILWQAWASPFGGPLLWTAGVIGALLTSLYTYRMVLVVFFGEQHSQVVKRPGPAMTIPVAVLMALSVLGGFVNISHGANRAGWLSGLLGAVLPITTLFDRSGLTENLSVAAASTAFALGLGLAWLLWGRAAPHPALSRGLAGMLGRWWRAGWGFDWFYDRVFVRPVVWMARVNAADFVDMPIRGAAQAGASLHRALSATESGLVRWYAAAIVAGSIALMGVSLLL